MISILSRHHPLETTYKKILDLVKAVHKLRRYRDQLDRVPSTSFALRELTTRSIDLRFAIGLENDWRSACGTTSRNSIRKTKVLFGRFRGALRELDRGLRSDFRNPATEITRDVRRATAALGMAVARLENAVKSGSVKVVEFHGKDIEGFIKVRDAMFIIDKKSAEELTGLEVDSWCNWPGVDTENPRQVLRVAKLIRLSKLPGQTFGLSVQSDAPGRPLKHMIRPGKFPTEEDLRVLGRRMGGPQKVYVTASKPGWRKVWTFERDEVSWWE